MEVPRNNFLKNYLKPNIKYKIKAQFEENISEISNPNKKNKIFMKVMNIFERNEEFEEINKEINDISIKENEEKNTEDLNKKTNEIISIAKNKRHIFEKVRYSLDGLNSSLNKNQMAVIFDEPFYNLFSDKEAIIKSESKGKNKSLKMSENRNSISPNVKIQKFLKLPY